MARPTGGPIEGRPAPLALLGATPAAAALATRPVRDARRAAEPGGRSRDAQRSRIRQGRPKLAAGTTPSIIARARRPARAAVAKPAVPQAKAAASAVSRRRTTKVRLEEGRRTGDRERSRRLPPRRRRAVPIMRPHRFLGAGKTTLLNRWVTSPELLPTPPWSSTNSARSAIDHLLVEKAEGGLLTLSSGCICCTVRGDLDRDARRSAAPARQRSYGRPSTAVVIETTGLADPAPILNTIWFIPIWCCATGSTASSPWWMRCMGGDARAHEEAVKQVAVADSLVLTKTDLLPERRTRSPLRARLAAAQSRRRGLDADAGEASARRCSQAASSTSARRPAALARPDHRAPCSITITGPPGTSRTTTCTITTSGSRLLPDGGRRRSTGASRDVPRPASAATHGPAACCGSRASSPSRTIRNGRSLIQGVQHFFHPAHAPRAGPTPTTHAPGVHRARPRSRRRRALWAAFFGAPAIDRPDARGALREPVRGARRGRCFG